ncbi:hypothetical protein FOD74_00600 [Vibrio parahaemolyticus]|nr:hypothetical protein [Vibrio parahaemolyticus]
MPNIYLNKFIWLYISIDLLQSAIGYYRQILVIMTNTTRNKLVIMTNTTRNISKINDFVRHKNKLKLGEKRAQYRFLPAV